MTKDDLQKAFDKANEAMYQNNTYDKITEKLTTINFESDDFNAGLAKLVAVLFNESIRVNQNFLFKVLSELCDEK